MDDDAPSGTAVAKPSLRFRGGMALQHSGTYGNNPSTAPNSSPQIDVVSRPEEAYDCASERSQSEIPRAEVSVEEINEKTLTDVVLAQFQNAPNPRVKQIMTSLVRHLHDFVRDVELTFDEWRYAIDFLTRTGQMCTESRQEFIMLSDTMGVSMLVDAINHRMPEGATQTTVLGPFYLENPLELPLGYDLAKNLPGEKLFVQGTVNTAAGGPLANAIVDTWQSDAEGYYDVQRDNVDPNEPHVRGRFRTDSQGRFHFWTILPTPYAVPYDGTVGEMIKGSGRHPWRPAHLHFLIQADGHETLITHLFVEGSPYLDSDAVFGVKKSLIQTFSHEAPGIAPDGRKMDGPWRKLVYDFGLRCVAQPAPAAAAR